MKELENESEEDKSENFSEKSKESEGDFTEEISESLEKLEAISEPIFSTSKSISDIQDTVKAEYELEKKQDEEQTRERLTADKEKTNFEDLFKELKETNTELFNSLKEEFSQMNKSDVEVKKAELKSNVIDKKQRLNDLKGGAINEGLGIFLAEKALKTFGTKGMKEDVAKREAEREAEIKELEKELKEAEKEEKFFEAVLKNDEKIIEKYSEKEAKEIIKIQREEAKKESDSPKSEEKTTNEKLDEEKRREEELKNSEEELKATRENNDLSKEEISNLENIQDQNDDLLEKNDKIIKELKAIKLSAGDGDDLDLDLDGDDKDKKRNKRNKGNRNKPKKVRKGVKGLWDKGKNLGKNLLKRGGGLVKNIASRALPAAMEAGGSLLSAGSAALEAGGALLASNPIGWAIGGALAVGAAGYGIYHLMIDDDSEEIFDSLEDKGIVEHNFFGDSIIKDWRTIYLLDKKSLNALERYDDWSDGTLDTIKQLQKIPKNLREFIAGEISNGAVEPNEDGKLAINNAEKLSKDLKGIEGAEKLTPLFQKKSQKIFQNMLTKKPEKVSEKSPDKINPPEKDTDSDKNTDKDTSESNKKSNENQDKPKLENSNKKEITNPETNSGEQKTKQKAKKESFRRVVYVNGVKVYETDDPNDKKYQDDTSIDDFKATPENIDNAFDEMDEMADEPTLDIKDLKDDNLGIQKIDNGADKKDNSSKLVNAANNLKVKKEIQTPNKEALKKEASKNGNFIQASKDHKASSSKKISSEKEDKGWLDGLSYMIPGYGTYKAIKEGLNSDTFKDIKESAKEKIKDLSSTIEPIEESVLNSSPVKGFVSSAKKLFGFGENKVEKAKPKELPKINIKPVTKIESEESKGQKGKSEASVISAPSSNNSTVINNYYQNDPFSRASSEIGAI